MRVTFRAAKPEDAQDLLELRRAAIAVLAREGMPAARAAAWAANLTLAGMDKKLRDFEIWIAEAEGAPVAWGAIRGGYLAGLYTRPDFAGRGVGTSLLEMLEGLMRERGHAGVRADASINAEAFYLRRGYERAGDPTTEDGLPIVKRLASLGCG